MDEQRLNASGSVRECVDRNTPGLLHRRRDAKREYRHAHPGLDAADDAVQRTEFHATDMHQTLRRQKALQAQAIGAAGFEHQHARLASRCQHRHDFVKGAELCPGDKD